VELEKKLLKKRVQKGLIFQGDTLLSLSVGSIMRVPGTGHDIVGA